jgi:RimJ/RimL family protein N-acetyltransferase
MKLNNNTNIFETTRLLLIPTSEKDINFIFALLNSPKWLEFIGNRNVKSFDDAKQYIKEKIIPQYKKLGFGTYTIIRKLENTKIGTCGLYDREGIEAIDLGFAFLPKFEKNGYAYESANKMISNAFEKFKINKIKAITRKNNISSQRLLEKLDFKNNGLIRLKKDSNEMLLYIRIE